MKASLRRTLALRFAATMALGLLLAAGAFYWAAARALAEPVPTAVLKGDLLIALLAVVVAGSAATLVGAWHFTSSAVRPVAEITAQATRIEAGTLDQRIVAHADTEEYEGLVAVLNRMLERLERGFAAQRRLTADVSHELRTPLTALRGEIEVALRAERSPREYQVVLRSGLEEIERLSAMSEDLLLISRAEARLITLQRGPTDLSGIVRRALDDLRARIEEKRLDVRPSLDAGIEPGALDPLLVARLVGQLLDNAVKFTPPDGQVVVETELARSARGGVHLAVENAGPGVAAEDLPHLFEPFYRADHARTRGSGTGLGLALVAAIAHLHGGSVQAQNRDGRGVRIDVELPGLTLA